MNTYISFVRVFWIYIPYLFVCLFVVVVVVGGGGGGGGGGVASA